MLSPNLSSRLRAVIDNRPREQSRKRLKKPSGSVHGILTFSYVFVKWGHLFSHFIIHMNSS